MIDFEFSLLSVSTRGALYLNENLVNITGMEPSFWIAISLADLEFLQDKDVRAPIFFASVLEELTQVSTH